MQLSRRDYVIILILSILTALESLSIDLYLPAFKDIAKDLNTDMGNVQVSLSMFLGGFAVGQLLWGPLSDRYGRKKPLLIAISAYSIISILVVSATQIQEVWLYRFLQAFTGSAGVVIARAIVTDWFNKKDTAKIFAMLGLIMGIAPILAPSIGNYLLQHGHWYNVFIAMSVLGIFSIILVLFFLPESHAASKNKAVSNKARSQSKTSLKTMLQPYKLVAGNSQFLMYTIIGSFAYSALMIYISNSPFLIMEKANYSGTTYSLIFGANAVGMMLATFSVSILAKKYSLRQLVKVSSLAQTLIGILLIIAFIAGFEMVWILVLVFLFMIPTGVLFPTTTDLALAPFDKESGTASALFGFAQLGFTFVFSGIIGLVQNGSIAPMMISLAACGLFSWLSHFWKNTSKNRQFQYE